MENQSKQATQKGGATFKSRKSQKQRKRSRSRSSSIEKESNSALKSRGWNIVSDRNTPNSVIEIETQFEFTGTLRFKVKQGSVEVFGREITKKHDWLSIVSDAKKDLIYPITKKSQEKVTIEIAENIHSTATEEEKSNLIQSEVLGGLRNFREIDQHDNQLNRFVKDDTWMKPLKDKSNDIFFIIGPANCGKSTYANFLVNQLADQHTKANIYFLDADSGQPNFTLPGQLSLMKLKENQESANRLDMDIVQSIFFNSSNPATDPDAYLKSVQTLVRTFKGGYYAGEAKLVINTCGWVEGLGAELISEMASWFQALPSTLFVTMSSSKQSEVQVDSKNQVVVKGDLAQQNTYSKGSVLRNYRLFNSLTIGSESGSSKIQMFSTLNDSQLRTRQAIAFYQKKHIEVRFDQITLIWSQSDAELPATKFNLLQQFNMQLVAALNIKNNHVTHSVDGLQVKEYNCDFREEIAFFGFVRDIHFERGFQLITADREVKSTDFNALAICSPKLFSIPQSFILKPEVIEELMALQITQEKGDTRNLLTDLLP